PCVPPGQAAVLHPLRTLSPREKVDAAIAGCVSLHVTDFGRTALRLFPPRILYDWHSSFLHYWLCLMFGASFHAFCGPGAVIAARPRCCPFGQGRGSGAGGRKLSLSVFKRQQLAR